MLLPPVNLPENIVLLITDTLPSPASFLLHKALASHLKSLTNTRRTATVISVSEDLAKWKSIASRSNLNVNQQIESGALTFIDTLPLVQPPSPDSSRNQPALRPLLDSIVNSFTSNIEESERLVILDDVSTLEWIGFSLLDVSRFVRALVAACRHANATLIIRHHLTLSDEIDDLFRRLLQLSTYHLEVLSLSSGRSGAVSGEIALHSGPSTPNGPVKLIPRSSALQYRLTDTGAVFFERGTGAAVL
ncbi:hypothetical protein NP233_g9916 [Leucocoprinus birnbaumii]|uniref:Elongator complex protein 6 n=1 Tax=Leucocoprinus birnbaumii TaxID=56174 RepID=A0AAD5VJB3_9AGAR|nr:hypothetical protein NP233_g9916 [Leucocoprinus birnbaumii]